LSLRRFLVVALLLGLSACASLGPGADTLRVNLSSLQMLQATLLEQRFRAGIRIQNRSRSALEVEGLTFDLALNGRDFASGVSDQHLTIGELSEAVVSVDLTSTLFGMQTQLRALQALSLEEKPFRYTFSGVLYTRDSPFGIAFSDEGAIDLSPPLAK